MNDMLEELKQQRMMRVARCVGAVARFSFYTGATLIASATAFRYFGVVHGAILAVLCILNVWFAWESYKTLIRELAKV